MTSNDYVPDAADCADSIRRDYATLGVEVTVRTAPPLVIGAYEPAGWTCPHGVTYWCEPTGEQIAQWCADGTP